MDILNQKDAFVIMQENSMRFEDILGMIYKSAQTGQTSVRLFDVYISNELINDIFKAGFNLIKLTGQTGETITIISWAA